MLMSCAVDAVAARTPGKESVAAEAFARALRQLPTAIADNAGYDSSLLVSQLRAEHATGKATSGLSEFPPLFQHIMCGLFSINQPNLIQTEG